MPENTPILFAFTQPVILTFPNLFTPKAFKGKGGQPNGEAKYSANFMFAPDHPDLPAYKAALVAAAKQRWPSRDIKSLAFPLANGTQAADKRRDRTGKDDGEFQRGQVIVAARSKFPPSLAVIANGQVLDLDDNNRAAHSAQFYFGTECLAQVNLVAYEGVGQNPDGVTAYLQMVLSLNRGKKLSSGGAPSAAEAFRGYVGQHTQAPALDDEIPF